jgi:hypothetical protein
VLEGSRTTVYLSQGKVVEREVPGDAFFLWDFRDQKVARIMAITARSTTRGNCG